ncbi:caspase, EACC1-associated type [Micromonospora sp. DT53]|uniref:caspase, EACC1-associated type n=1 Tax=Micromonospora sp. DT53 TaxID=3393444 RepID=UPI003CF25B08
MSAASASGSRAVLIGSARYTSEDFEDADAVRRNVVALKEVLTQGPEAPLLPEACRTVFDPPTQDAMLDPISVAATEATDMLLVYFSGHGLLPRRGDLHLAVTGASRTEVHKHASYSRVASLVDDSKARVKVVILDCCHSGAATELPLVTPGRTTGEEPEGLYVLTSCSRTLTSQSHGPHGYTAFTGHLLEIVRTGVAELGTPYLNVSAIYAAVRARMMDLRFPPPQAGIRNTAGEAKLFRNRQYRATAAGGGRSRMPAATHALLIDHRRQMLNQTGRGLLPHEAERDLADALAEVAPMTTAELTATWIHGVWRLPASRAPGALDDYGQLLWAAAELVYEGDPAEHPVFRCAARIARQLPGRPEIRMLADWMTKHRPPHAGRTAAAATAAVIVVMSPAVRPNAQASVGRRYYTPTVLLHTDVDGFTSWYPDTARYPDADAVTLAEAAETLAPVLYDGLTQLAAEIADSDDEPVVEFVLPDELWDEPVEKWRLRPDRALLGRRYPTVVRPLSRLHDKEAHRRWRASWRTLMSRIHDGRPVPVVCRTCAGLHDDDSFHDFLDSAEQEGVIVLADRLPSGDLDLPPIRYGLRAGVPGFVWTRAAHTATSHGAAAEFHIELERRLLSAPAHHVPRLTHEIRRRPEPPFTEGIVLMWDDPSRQLPASPLAAPGL